MWKSYVCLDLKRVMIHAVNPRAPVLPITLSFAPHNALRKRCDAPRKRSIALHEDLFVCAFIDRYFGRIGK